MKYPNIKVQLTGQDGNVFGIIGAVSKALKRGGVAPETVKEFTSACFSAESYDHVLRLCMDWVSVS